jgi:acetyl/propionyl-CoA carboxylase alpha subunit
MGRKTESRRLMEAAGVPVVPGTNGPAQGAAELKAFAREAGYPVLLKASAGGGGKGMRRADSDREIDGAFERVTSEASLYFGDAAVYAEKLIDRPRHVEIQIIGDERGHRTTVGERECSIQRRHQKVVEECPSPIVHPGLRERMSATALAAADAVGYSSCGTVEFLLAPDETFYFLEMNTRLQVEHTVTEEVWGIDLVTEMIRVALGEPLSIRASGLQPRGHAIECRIYAEDPERGFSPSPGTIGAVRLPQGPGVRHDLGFEAGTVVPIDYDPMLGKLIVRGASRPEALSRLARALEEYEIGEVETTLPLFRALVRDAEFAAGSFDVQWLDRRLADGLMSPSAVSVEEVLAAAVSAAESCAAASPPVQSPSTGWKDAARLEGLR